MIYTIKAKEQENNGWTVQIPDNLDQDIVDKIILHGKEVDSWEIVNKIPDSDFSGEVDQKAVDLINPYLFVDNDEEGNIIPDTEYFRMVDKKFIDDMLLLWSKTKRADYIRVLDEVGDWEYLYNLAVCQDIVE